MDQNKTQTGTVTHQYTPTNRKSVQYLKAFRKNVWKTEVIFCKSKGHYSFNNQWTITKLKLDL